AKDPWKSIHPIELLHYFGCLILTGLFGQPPRKYAWNSRNGYLRDTSISKNRFEESIVYGTTLKLSEGTLEEVLPPSKEERKGPKRVRGTLTKWKCSECAVPICRARSDCWE